MRSSVTRWLWYSVILALVPIALSWIFLPSTAHFEDAFSHGELVILAEALAASSIGALFARPEEQRKDIELLVSLNIGFLAAGLVVLAGVVGGAGHLKPAQAVELSYWLLGLTVIVGSLSNREIEPLA